MTQSHSTNARSTNDIAFGRLGFGAANIGNLYRVISDEQAWSVLDAAWDAGIRYFDTAPHYGLGLSERRLGAFLTTKPRDEFILSTKVGRLLRPDPAGSGTFDMAHDFAVPKDVKRVWDFSAEGIRTSIEESLQRMGLETIDIAYLHDPEKYDLNAGIESGIPALSALRDTGLIRAIGVGSMSVPALLASVRTGMLDLLMIAGRFTLVEQPALADVIPECRERGVGVVNASVFNSGILATTVPDPSARYEYGSVPDLILARARAIAAVCADFKVELPAVALQYTLREPVVRTVVVGTSQPEQIRQNVERMNQTVPDEVFTRLKSEGLIPA